MMPMISTYYTKEKHNDYFLLMQIITFSMNTNYRYHLASKYCSQAKKIQHHEIFILMFKFLCL